MISIVNQFGRHLDGRNREEVIYAWEHWQTTAIIDGTRLNILGSDKDKSGNVTIRVEVQS